MLRVTVTQEDIDKGVRGDTTSCPIARAIKRLGYTLVRVLHSEVEFYAPEKRTYSGEEAHVATTPLPKAAQRFIESFDTLDEGLYPEPGPFSFELPEPPDSAKAQPILQEPYGE